MERSVLAPLSIGLCVAIEIEPAIPRPVRDWQALALAVHHVSIGHERQRYAVHCPEVIPRIEARIDLEHVERVVARLTHHIDLEDPAKPEAPDDVETELFETRIACELDEGALAGHGRKRP